jgi:SAM-dependent methyltransferase
MSGTTAQPTGDELREVVRERYGEIARGEKVGCGPDPAGTCCSPSPSTGFGYAAEDLARLPEGADLGLGCGNPGAIAALSPGETVVDLGSGGGIDCFFAARAVGATGRVIGVDMTPDMVKRARANAAKVDATNVEFRLGEIEALPVADSTADVIISNCVVNLSPDKDRVFGEMFRVLRPGGRVAISDQVAVREMPPEVRADPARYAACISGAVAPEAVERMLRDAGFGEVKVDLRGDDEGSFVRSAAITATKPTSVPESGDQGCC